jgi:hypothetical protein
VSKKKHWLLRKLSVRRSDFYRVMKGFFLRQAIPLCVWNCVIYYEPSIHNIHQTRCINYKIRLYLATCFGRDRPSSSQLKTTINRLTPNDPYMGRAAPLTSKRCTLYIYSTNIGTEYFKHALYSPFFSLQNAVCFIMLTCLVPILFTFYIQDVKKLKKIFRAPKG